MDEVGVRGHLTVPVTTEYTFIHQVEVDNIFILLERHSQAWFSTACMLPDLRYSIFFHFTSASTLPLTSPLWFEASSGGISLSLEPLVTLKHFHWNVMSSRKKSESKK